MTSTIPFGFGFFSIFLGLIITGISIYALILFIMLARRGIRALDLYLKDKH